MMIFIISSLTKRAVNFSYTLLIRRCCPMVRTPLRDDEDDEERTKRFEGRRTPVDELFETKLFGK